MLRAAGMRGGSTISQQTAKNAFLWQGGGYVRKGSEAWFTVLIEAMWAKRRIMEVYLNVAETGIGTYGVDAGAQRYYGHDADAIRRTEAARLAAILPLPKKPRGDRPGRLHPALRQPHRQADRIGVVARSGLDACVYDGPVAPRDKTPPPSRKPTTLPGEEYETASPPPPAEDVNSPPVEAPVVMNEAAPPADNVPPSDQQPGDQQVILGSRKRRHRPTRISRPGPVSAGPGPTA